MSISSIYLHNYPYHMKKKFPMTTPTHVNILNDINVQKYFQYFFPHTHEYFKQNPNTIFLTYFNYQQILSKDIASTNASGVARSAGQVWKDGIIY